MSGDRAKALLGTLIVAAAYVVFAEVGFSLAFTTKQVTAVWPPTGIAVAALLIWGYRVWPGVFVGAFISNAISHEPPLTAAAIAVGNTLAPLAAVAMLRFAGFDNALERLRDVLGIVAVAALAMTISATNGVFQLVFAGIVPLNAFGSVWWVWWAGDAMGVLLFAPLILTLVTPSHVQKRAGNVAELVVLVVGLVIVSCFSFVSLAPSRLSVYPFVIWSALRFRQRETILAIVAIAAIAIWGTVHELGAFASGSVDERLVALMSFIAVLAVTGLVLGSVMAERNVALAQTTRIAETLQASFLPERLPQRPNLKCDALYRPASIDATIGGDWYDAFELPDGNIVISIGDVVGHGLNAAIQAGRIRQGIFATAFDSQEPATILERVNRTLHAQEETVATALVAIFDLKARQMRYATAGHPPPILANATSGAGSLPPGGVPLGIGTEIEGRTRIVPLERGSVVLFYTDGLTEFDRNIDRAEGLLIDAIARVAREEIVASPAAYVQKAVMNGAHPIDDVVLVIVQVTG